MGLNIVAVSDCVIAPEYSNISDEGFEERDDLIDILAGHFAQRLDGLPPGIYSCNPSQTFEFEVGPYSRYGWWRDLLSQMIYDVDSQAVFAQSDFNQGRPFFELICMSDSVGAIGPRTSAKLFRDFQTHDKQASQVAEEGFIELYRQFLTAFNVARHDGFVVLT